MAALVSGCVGWLQYDGFRTRRSDAASLKRLGLPPAAALDEIIPNRHHLWARPSGGVLGQRRGGGFVRNSFGDDVARYPTWEALCPRDSDLDGATNGEELGDPCCDAGVWARRWNLTHPGWNQQKLSQAAVAAVGPARDFSVGRKKKQTAALSPACAETGTAVAERHEAQFRDFYFMRHAADLEAGDAQRNLKSPALLLILACLGRWAARMGLLEDISGLARFRAKREAEAGPPLTPRARCVFVVAAYFWTDLVAGLTHLTFDFAPWDYPVIGDVARGFQFHHVHPSAWCVVPPATLFSHSFLLLGTLSAGLLLLRPRRCMRLFWCTSFALCLLTVLTHRWVHMEPETLPPWFRLLQRTGLLMSHDHHMQHHRSLVTQFSNLSGVTDRFLNRLTTYVPATHFQHWLTAKVSVFALTIFLGADPSILRADPGGEPRYQGTKR